MDENPNVIPEFQGEYRWLSNMWMAPVKVGELTFPCNENAFHAAKSTNEKDWLFLAGPDITPYRARIYGRNEMTLREDWEDIKLEVMRLINRAKYDQHPDLREKLLATEGKTLIEGNYHRDTFWGQYRGKGENHLGRILMVIRDDYLSKQRVIIKDNPSRKVGSSSTPVSTF